MAEELSEKEFYKRELAHNDTFRYLNASQQRNSYQKYLSEVRQAEELRRESAHEHFLCEVLRPA